MPEEIQESTMSINVSKIISGQSELNLAPSPAQRPAFRIEQLAFYPRDPGAAMELLTAMGAGKWAADRVVAVGSVFGEGPQINEANLHFEYDMLNGAKELEVLHYTHGAHWMAQPYVGFCASHIGMHCTEDELVYWKQFFAERGIEIAQEVNTESHTNPVIKDSRRYHYCIFNTRDILSVDVKFIVRRDI